MHPLRHPLAGRKVHLNVKASGPIGLAPQKGEFRIEDWWDRVGGGSWMNANGNPACLNYAMRSALGGLPLDDEVVYGKQGGLGYLVHISELGEEVLVDA